MIRSPRINSKGEDTTAIFGFLNVFEEIARQADGARIAVVFDPPGGTFRSEMFEEYKAQREETPEGIRFGIPYIKRIIEAYGIHYYEVPGYEADDVIGTIATQIGTAQPDMEVYMITPDKDYGQLVCDNVKILKPKNGGGFELLGREEVLSKYGLQSTDQVIDLLALWGDTADNVPGIKGIGEKTAAKLLSKYGDINGIYDHIDEIKGKQKENLMAGREQLALSRDLVTIRTDVPITYDLSEMEPQPKDLQALVDIYEALEFRSKLGKLQEEYGLAKGTAQSRPLSLFDQTADAPKVESKYDTMADTDAKYHLVESAEEIEALAKRLSEVPIFAFDTETAGLDGMSADIVGISFAIEPGEAWYIPLSQLPMEARMQLDPFAEAFANPEILKVGQNLKFDLKMIERYGIKAVAPFWDTMIAHYLIQPELRHGMDAMAESYLGYRPQPIEELIGPKGKKQKSMQQLSPQEVYKYACEDADITLRLYEKLREELKREGLEELFYQIEMPLMEVLLTMEQTGVKLDTKVLTETVRELYDELEQLERAIYNSAGGEVFNINSPKEVGELLFDRLQLVENPKKTKTGQYVTREEELQKVAHLHPVVGMILRYRGLRKLVSTYIEPLPLLINKQTGRIHTTYNQTATATGRLSSTDPNLQNIPVRDEDGRQIRKAFTALHPEKGEVYVSADYSQIELRLMAHFADDQVMIRAFNDGVDIHALTASKIYHTTPDEVTAELRRRAKTANFGIIYGISSYGLSSRLGISFGEAKELIEGYFRTYPAVKKYMEDIVERAKEQEFVETIMGRRRFLKDINARNSVVRSFAERNAINAPLQGSAADIIKVAMIRIQRRLKEEGFGAKMILQVHDELNFSCPKEELEALTAMVREEMEGICPDLRVPLVVDVGVGENWLEAH